MLKIDLALDISIFQLLDPKRLVQTLLGNLIGIRGKEKSFLSPGLQRGSETGLELLGPHCLQVRRGCISKTNREKADGKSLTLSTSLECTVLRFLNSPYTFPLRKPINYLFFTFFGLKPDSFGFQSLVCEEFCLRRPWILRRRCSPSSKAKNSFPSEQGPGISSCCQG